MTFGISERVHYPPLTHNRGSRGSSCCAVTVSHDRQNVQPLTSNDVSNSPSAWSHVYSQSNANSSRRTQCASVTYSTNGLNSSVRHRQNRCAKKKLQKQRSVFCEIIVLSDHVPFSLSDIEDEIIVFDGGNLSCPPITPPKTVEWRRHHVSDLHIQDDLQGDIGLWSYLPPY